MDRGKGGEQPLIIGGVGRVADADERAVNREESAAAASLDGLTGDLHVRRPQIFVDGCDAAVMDRRIVASVAADCHDGCTWLRAVVDTADTDRFDLPIGEDAHQREIAFEIPGDDLARHAPRTVRAEQVDLHPALPLRIAKNVAAGENQRFALTAVDHGPGATRHSMGILDEQPRGRRHEPSLERGPLGGIERRAGNGRPWVG